ncbi:hypothetical protein, partial [Marinobacter alexandrii]|uniref:hypothetical protein n=1 Tax=Marinobacter alexandrii TaxID=2570351 RepID=UPI003297DF89
MSHKLDNLLYTLRTLLLVSAGSSGVKILLKTTRPIKTVGNLLVSLKTTFLRSLAGLIGLLLATSIH